MKNITAPYQLIQRYELFRNEYSDLEELIPQYLIASYLGITPTQLVSATLISEFLHI